MKMKKLFLLLPAILLLATSCLAQTTNPPGVIPVGGGIANTSAPPVVGPALPPLVPQVAIYSGTNSTPENVIQAPSGSLYQQFSNGTNYIQTWIKSAGTGKTGWIISTNLSLGVTAGAVSNIIVGLTSVTAVQNTPTISWGVAYSGGTNTLTANAGGSVLTNGGRGQLQSLLLVVPGTGTNQVTMVGFGETFLNGNYVWNVNEYTNLSTGAYITNYAPSTPYPYVRFGAADYYQGVPFPAYWAAPGGCIGTNSGYSYFSGGTNLLESMVGGTNTAKEFIGGGGGVTGVQGRNVIGDFTNIIRNVNGNQVLYHSATSTQVKVDGHNLLSGVEGTATRIYWIDSGGGTFPVIQFGTNEVDFLNPNQTTNGSFNFTSGFTGGGPTGLGDSGLVSLVNGTNIVVSSNFNSNKPPIMNYVSLDGTVSGLYLRPSEWLQGASFTIRSSNSADTNKVGWIILP
jgi:hypothetical protein